MTGSRFRPRTVAIALGLLVVVIGPAVVVAVRADRGNAAFGDQETIGLNHMSSARVSIETGERTVPIVASRLAPGDVVFGRIELVNGGTVPLHFSVVTRAVSSPLVDWVVWRFAWSPDRVTCPSSVWASDEVIELVGRTVASEGARLVGDPSPGIDPGDRPLAVDERDLLCVALELSIDTPNELQAHRLDQAFVVHAEQDEVDR